MDDSFISILIIAKEWSQKKKHQTGRKVEYKTLRSSKKKKKINGGGKFQFVHANLLDRFVCPRKGNRLVIRRMYGNSTIGSTYSKVTGGSKNQLLAIRIMGVSESMKPNW